MGGAGLVEFFFCREDLMGKGVNRVNFTSQFFFELLFTGRLKDVVSLIFHLRF